MDAEGTKFLKITSTPEGYSWPKWSPDGEKILCNSLGDGGYSLWQIEIDYERVKQIIFNPSPNNYTGEAWSTTGNRSVVKQALLNPRLLMGGIKTITSQYVTWDGYANYSPDGSKIAYISSKKDGSTEFYDINVMNADGSNPINLTNSIGTQGRGQFNDWPSWSPDGKKISFVSDRDGKPLDMGIRFKNAWQIYTMNADGSNITRSVNNNFADGSPNWGRVPYDLAEKLTAPSAPGLTINPEVTISALEVGQIRKYIGRDVAIEGKVVEYGSAWDIETRPMLIYFDNPEQHCNSYDAWNQGQCGTDFRVVINAQDFKRFPDVFTYLDNKVRVVGKVEYYKGAASIIARDPQQITFIK